MSNKISPFILHCYRKYDLWKVKNPLFSRPKIVNHQTTHCRLKQIHDYKYVFNVQINCIKNTPKNVQNYCLKFQKRDFRTTVANKALAPILWVVIRSTLKIIAVMIGRMLRQWWMRLPPGKKQQIINKIRENRPGIWIGNITLGGMVFLYYSSHLVEDPVTKRKKFLLFSEEQTVEIAKMEYDFLMKKLKKKIINSGNLHEDVVNITKRILKSNKHFPGVNKTWEVVIIDEINQRNAFVLPSGHIFIFTGMLKVISNDDQLAIVLAHEMAHALLNHSAEVFSRAHLSELLLLLPIIIIWTLLPDFIALSSHILLEMATTVLYHLPMNRQLELEADVVGIAMAARACYDPHQAIVFWKNMENLGELETFEWFSTHPTYRSRYKTLESRMPELLNIYDRHCKKSNKDPQN